MTVNSTYSSPALLLSDFQSGKELALNAIYTLHSAAIYHFVHRIVLDDAVTDEIVAESFFRLWNKRHKIETIQGLVGYLYVIARNLSYAYQNEEKKRQAALAAFAYHENQVPDPETEEMRSRLLQAVYLEAQQMPPQMKNVFLLAYLEGMQVPEIAKQLEVSVNTVKTHKKAALKKVREALAKKGITKWSYLLQVVLSWWL
jgi:RNA polymerase sigma factor (sigma-70 family)